jgi:protein-S-isoprenylcysteine O-methyltransferase Ste14
VSTTVIVILIVIIVALVAVGGAFYLRQKRSERLREEFGPEYEREVASAPSRTEAENRATASSL